MGNVIDIRDEILYKDFEDDCDPDFDLLIEYIKRKAADDKILDRVKGKNSGSRSLHDIDINRLNDVYRCTGLVDRFIDGDLENFQLINADGNHRFAEIKVDGYNISIKDMKLFSEFASIASNIEFYTDNSGKVTMGCMFYGIWRS